MTLRPVIARELRVGARRWTTYWLRLGAGSAVVAAVFYWLLTRHAGRRAGSEMFVWMHRVVLTAIWVLVPLMSCDALSHEKREGTLGLLFLTNLKAREIVLAKAAAHGLRALTLWLAAIPIVGVPMLIGGLDWREIVFSCCIAFGSICFALSLGLLASAMSKRIGGAVGLVALFAPAVHVIFTLCVLAVISISLTRMPLPFMRWDGDILSRTFSLSSRLIWNVNEVWREFVLPRNKFVSQNLLGALYIPLVALVFLLGACALLIAPIIRRNWQDKPKTKRQSEVENFFCAPVFLTGLFRWWMRRSLDRNPIGWLEKRSWTGRIAALIWLAVMISFASGIAYERSRDYVEGFNVLMWMLLGSIAYVAAGSFRRERETGALELILVTPLSERQIISGRLRGLWSQFLPAFALWVVVVVYLSSALKDWQVANIVRFTVAYAIVPVAGLYFSLRSRFVLLSWLATLAACFALPQLLWWTFYYVMSILYNVRGWESAFPSLEFSQVLMMLTVQLVLAGLLFWRLRVNLVRRTFSLR